jgi:hypothetical protein
LFGAQRRRETTNPLQFLELIKATFDYGRNKRQQLARVEASQRKLTGPKKGQVPETDDTVFTFSQQRCKTGKNCIVLFLRHTQQLYHFSKIPLSTMNLLHI